MKLQTIVAISLALSACAMQQDVPIVGPSATVRDSVHNVEFSRAELCFLSAIDGKEIPTSVGATFRSSGQARLRPTVIDRKVPAKPFVATIECRSASMRPFDYSRKARGTVSFQPKPGASYVVNGSISDETVSVWIEVEGSSERATATVTATQ